jgi:hypothetical protein
MGNVAKDDKCDGRAEGRSFGTDEAVRSIESEPEINR